MWQYRAKLVKVIDGDTIDVIVDVGFHTFKTERIRLLGVNTPEKKKPIMVEGLAAQKFTEDWFAKYNTSEWPFRVETKKADAFGRYLALVTTNSDVYSCLNNELLEANMAVEDIR